jgi:adenylate cyclase
MKLILTIVTIIFLTIFVNAQNQQQIDSLKDALKKHDASKKELGSKAPAMYDTAAANILYDLSRAYSGNNNDKAMDYANECLAMSERMGYKKGIGNAYSSIGTVNKDKGNYLLALEFQNKALKIREEIDDKKGIAGSYNNLGNVYQTQGNYSEALKNYFAALKINEETGNKNWQAINLNNIGLIYLNQDNYSDALKNFNASLKIKEEVGDKSGIASSYGNIGNVFEHKGDYPEALKNYLEAFKINEESGNKNWKANNLSHIATIYNIQGNYSEALKSNLAALKLKEEIGAKRGIAASCANIGETYIFEKNYHEAAQYLNKALKLSSEIGSLEEIRNSYKDLAKLDSAQAASPLIPLQKRGEFAMQGMEDYKLYITFRDSMVNNENTKKTMALQMNYEFDKKQDSLNAVQAKKDVVTTEEQKRQRQQKYILLIGLVFALGFGYWDFRQKKRISKEKKRSEELLLNILPAEVAEELKLKGTSEARDYEEVTVMFTDFKDFTRISEKMTSSELVKEIDYCFSAFDNIIHKNGIEKIKTIGDAYMCAGGLPVANKTHAEDTLKAALEIRDFMTNHNKNRIAKGELPFEIRIGINTGPVVAGIVGVKKFAYDIWGDTVNLASRMESSGEAGKVNISGSTYELVKDKFTCTHRGKIQTKNKGEVDMYFVSE